MSKHTSGPWSFDGPPDNHIVWGPSGEGRICFMAHSAGVDPEGDTANARLIASAPDLLEALQDIATRKGWENFPDEVSYLAAVTAHARKAIAKALGEQA